MEEFCCVLWTRTEPRGEGLQSEVAAALSVQRVEDVLQLLGRQRQLPVEPLPGTQKHREHLNTVGNSKQRRPGWGLKHSQPRFLRAVLEAGVEVGSRAVSTNFLRRRVMLIGQKLPVLCFSEQELQR